MSEPGVGDLAPKDPLLTPQENMEMQDTAFDIFREAFLNYPTIRGVFDWDGPSITTPPLQSFVLKKIYESGRVITGDHIEIHLNTTERKRGPDDPVGKGVRFRRPKPNYAGERGVLSEFILYDRDGTPIPRQNTQTTRKEILSFARSLLGAK